MIRSIRNAWHDSYVKFANSQFYQTLKGIPPLRKLKHVTSRVSGTVFSAVLPVQPPLYGDPIFQEIFLKVGKQFGATSMVETGTYLGSTTEFLAKNFPKIPIYTTDVNKVYFEKAQKRLKGYKNVSMILKTSPQAIDMLIDKKLLGARPMFFLDAHWLDDWPLEEEIEIITRRLKEAIVVIHDFKIPGNKDFKYDRYGGKECSLEMILPRMHTLGKYNLLLPTYGKHTLKRNDYYLDLVGYPVIFQNLSSEFAALKKDPTVETYFTDRSDLLKIR